MSDTRYPTRMHEVLGVEIGERFEIPNYAGAAHVDMRGYICGVEHNDVVSGARVCEAINHGITRRPRLTHEQEAQLKVLNTLGFKWLAKQRKGCVMFFQKKPHKNAIWFSGTGDEQEDYGVVLPNDTNLSSLVSWSDPEPLDIVQVLRENGVEVEVE